ncbi:MAG: class II aldolase/adducin family protein [Armatimonadetes bacterium]|nr:class II aldolase/adducin family protein [Armatimonadota bacterium]
MESVASTLHRQLIRFGAEAFRARLIVSTCGNASLRLGSAMLVTGSGSQLGKLRSADLSLVDLAEGTRLEGPVPSSESLLHRLIYLVRTEVGAILHCQSEAATCLACHPDPPEDLNFIPEVPVYVGRHAWVPYLEPGSPELAEAVKDQLQDPEIGVVQLRNHGQVVVGRDPAEALRRALFFERACGMALRGGLRTLTAPQVSSLQKRYGAGKA